MDANTDKPVASDGAQLNAVPPVAADTVGAAASVAAAAAAEEEGSANNSAAKLAPRTLWTWVNPSQRHLCLADVTPQCTSERMPEHFGQIVAILETMRPTQSNILFGLVYAVALECGFCALDAAVPADMPPASWWFSFNAQFVRHCAGSLPPDFYDYANNVCRIVVRLHGLSERRCTLIGRDIGGTLCVSLNTEDGRLGYSVCLPVAAYVVRQQLQLGAKCVKNMDELVEKLRNRVFGPVRNGLLEAEQRPSPDVLGVPSEVRDAVYGCLGVRDLQLWSGVCRVARAEVLELARVRRICTK